jgi:hypothetical protein
LQKSSKKFCKSGLALPGEVQAKFIKSFCNCPGKEIASTEGKRQRKRLFFEKKNQKTLTNAG